MNAESRFATQVPPVGDFGRVHLIGIGGAGMSVIASLLAARGLPVQGSDAKPSAVLDALGAQGITTWTGHDGGHVAGANTIVISSAVRETNPELIAARTAGIRILHRSQALAALMTDSRAVAVAGAHGKTTTSAMLAVVLRAAGLDPSFAIGSSIATPSGRVSGGNLGAGDVIVVEADESDGSFLNYQPDIAIVTNVEPDHLDHYGSRDAFAQAFVDFALRIRAGGRLVACADDDGARELAQSYAAMGGSVLTYGFSDDADVRISHYEARAAGSTATLTFGPTMSIPLELGVPGRYNVLNAAGAVAGAILLGVAAVDAARFVGEFSGTGRRFDSRGIAGGVHIVDDYAHHPTEVDALLSGARPVAAAGVEGSGPGRVVVLFQPHLFSRTRIFAAEFAAALDKADVVVLCDIYGARELPEPGVTSALITDLMTSSEAEYVPDRLAAAARVADLALPGDLVLTVGAGDVTELATVILEALVERGTGRSKA